MVNKKEKLIPPRRRDTMSPPWDSLPMLRHLARLFIVVAMALAFAPAANANQFSEASIKFESLDMNAKQGVLVVTIPSYDDHDDDEAMSWQDGHNSGIWINGKQIVRFTSRISAGTNQDDRKYYWHKTYIYGDNGKNFNTYVEKMFVEETWNFVNDKNQDYGSAYSTPQLRDITSGQGSDDHGKYKQVYLQKVDNGQTYATYRIYLKGDFLRDSLSNGTKSIKVKVFQRMDVKGGDDYEFSKEVTLNTYTLPTAPTFSYDFSSNAGYYKFKIQNTKSGDSYKISNPTGIVNYYTTINSTSVDNDIYAENNDPVNVVVNYRSKINDYVNIENTYTTKLKAYPWPANFGGEFSASTNGKVLLSWYIPKTYSSGNDCQEGDEFELERSTDENFSASYTTTLSTKVQYNRSTQNYELYDDVSGTKFDGTYYYRIRRTASASKWGWNESIKCSVPVSTKHKYIKSATAVMSDDTHVKITWDYDDGNVWSQGSKITITRFNTAKGTSYSKELSDEEINARSYTEELTTSCDVYTFDIAVVPGNTQYQRQTSVEVSCPNPIFIANVGKVTSLSASKGYFSDHVELEWTSDQKPIDVFSIRAREYGSGEDFRQIDQVSANMASKDYSYTDIKSNPGVVYEYQIAAVTKCGTQTVEEVYDKIEVGFRTPTGDIYGRVTFESGQAVPDAEVRAEVSDGTGITGKAYRFDGSNKLTTDTTLVLKNATNATLEAWVKPEGNGVIVKKPGMYTLEYLNDKFKFTVGSQSVTTTDNVSKFTKSASFVHVSAVADTDKIYLYVNDTIQAVVNRTATVTDNNSQVEIGEGFKGVIDDVRLWSVARDSINIARDYGRYIVGNETGLDAYYTFDYSVSTQFFDISYKGTKYNKNHGSVSGATLVEDDVPTTSQLGFRSYTDTDGSYSLRSLPYRGNGTTYMVIPRLGIHKFESEKELRLLSEKSQSHTVNFTDKSSFEVSGKVYYDGGEVPVEGVMFKVDGVVVMDGKNNIIKTDADGHFTINVPVGTHEVRAELANHTFKKDGRITNLDGSDRNYQDMLPGVEIIDITRVRYIGRVAGGGIQEEYPLGHSLSKNNLADGIKVTLTYQGKYEAYSGSVEKTYEHFDNPYVKGGPKTNTANFSGNTITVIPNAETGEFMVDLLPLSYSVKVAVPGYDNISGNNEPVDLTNCFVKQYSVNEYVDSVSVEGQYINRTDSVEYNQMSKFIAKVDPSILVKQLENGSEIDYFGKEKIKVTTLDNSNSYELTTYDKDTGKYVIGMPIYEQYQNVTFGITTAEVYRYKDVNGNDKEGVEEDIVAVPEATLSFGGDLAYSGKGEEDEEEGDDEEIVTDENGYAEWTFQVDEPNTTSGLRSVSMTMTYDGSDKPIDWDGKFNAVVIGSVINGSDFITEGPDKLMFVLRDPPGTNSYSYLEKGITVSRTSSYTGELVNNFNITSTKKVGAAVITFVGLGAGSINNTELKNENGFGVSQTTMIGGTNSDYSEFSTTTRFTTSSDPLYVGSNGDLYVGYSTNIGVGTTDNIAVMSQKEDTKNADAYTVLEDLTSKDAEYVVVKTRGLSLAEKYKTMFAYPQVFLENTMIPKWKDTRNQLLHQEGEVSDWQALADSTKTNYYVSKLPTDNPNFGRSNNDPVFGNNNLEDAFDGPSYKIYFPTNYDKVKTDSILVFNQSIERWEQHIADNEQQKVNAEPLNNVSFQAGGTYAYSESFATTRTETQRFSFTLAGNYFNDFGVNNNSAGFIISIDENASTTHGGEFTDEETAAHCQGFELVESGDDDYISVDICRETGYNKDGEFIKYKDMNSEETQFSTFIFKTKGGATSCPYEGEEKTRYYMPGKKVLNQATVQIEVPELSVENDYIQNVPSGKPAYFTLYLRNNSQAQEDGWFNLCLDGSSNEDGAQLYIDGAPVSTTGIPYLVPAGGSLKKTLEVRKGKAMTYDGLRLTLQSQCQCDPTDFLDDIVDDVILKVSFTPSATDVNIKSPSDNWTYNTKLPTEEVNGNTKHYMEITLNEFDVNYDNFQRVMLQYKPASGSDDDWITLKSFYNDTIPYKEALAKNQNAEMIDPTKAGTITYKLFMDDLPDQRYDLRAVGTSKNGVSEVYNYSAVHSGIKDMYNPRLFGSAQPANGVLTVNDEIRLNFNETIAEGLLTDNNFEVTGIRNGAQTDHSVSVRLDGENDVLTTEFNRNWHNKPLTVEMWVLADKPQDAVLFSQGTANSAIELGITADNRLKVKVGDKTIISDKQVAYDQGTWAHVAMTYDGEEKVSAFYNFVEYISEVETNGFDGEGTYTFGASIDGKNNFAGNMHNARIWDKVVSSARLQTNSLTLLSGSESNLLAYYPMSEARGDMLADKAHGANLELNGGTWVVPEGRAVKLDGTRHLDISSGSSCVIDSSMDYTMELWFKAEEGQTNAAIVSNGRGDGGDFNHSFNEFCLGFDEEGRLAFSNNGTTATCTGTFNDNNWHHAAVAVNRTSGRAQIYVDGKLNTYFDANDLGGISSAYFNLGARVWSSDTTSVKTTDNYFKGEIDEFRMWKLYRSESIVSETFTQQLDGTEQGLMAYYPFETYVNNDGIKELTFSACDAKVQKDASMAVKPIEITDSLATVTKVSAPVKSKGPVSKLLYDFVVNNDALIITLKEPYERIEKTIVTFTVDGVRDLNGNEIVSPITWSAYIDRNQLKWSESSLSVSKMVQEEKQFTVRANNNGGSIQHYTIENMPSWLDVTPSSGTIDPVSGVDIKFTVDAGLNIGTYDEVIYLRNDNNVVEALELTVKVDGEKPSWSVNPADYQYNMSIFGKMLINNTYSSDEEDILAAFDGNECVGICTNKYYKVNDMWYAMLTVYSNQTEASKDLEFRIWDASTGSTYIAEPSSPIHFVNNSVIGSPSNPVVFTAKDMRVQQINLAEGWSWISLNVNNKNLSDINALLAGNTWTADDLLKSETDGFVSYSSNGWVGTLPALNNTSMYMMRSAKAMTLDISGAPIDTKTCKLSIIGTKDDGTARWNYISYLPADNMTLKEALAGYEASEGDIVKSQTAVAMYDGNVGWIGSLEYMESGKGYMLQRQAKTDAELQYPSKSSIGRKTMSVTRTRANDNEACTEVAEYGRRYATNMTAVIRVEGIEASEGDQLAAYAESGECRGVANATTMSDGSTLFLMTINGDASEAVDIALQRADDVKAVAKGAVTYGANATVGSLKSPMVIRFGNEGENVMVYPTPFHSVLNIKASADADAKVDVFVTDVAGARVAQWHDCNDNGSVNIVWDVNDNIVVDGVYIVNVVINGKVNAIKTVKR